MAASRGDGVDWTYTLNTRDWPNNVSPTLDDLGKLVIDALLDKTSFS